MVKLSEFFRKWKLLLLGFARDSNRTLRRQFQRIVIQINGHIIPIEKRIRFLGLIFDRNNRFVGHIDHALKRARKSFFALRPMLRSKIIETKIKTNMYKAYIRPVLTYASAIWAVVTSDGTATFIREKSAPYDGKHQTSNRQL